MRVPKSFTSMLTAFGLTILLAGCGSGSSSGQSSTASSSDAQQISSRSDYNNMKSMMMDILHSQAGKDGLKEIFQDPTFRKSIAINQHDVNQALVESISSGPNRNLLQVQMSDPVFASALVKATKKEHQVMLKTLMKDPEYQTQMLTLMKSPSFQQTLIPLMQTPEYRQAIMKIMMDSLQNPEFKLLYMETIKEAIRSGAGVSKMNTGGAATQLDQAAAQKKMGDQASTQGSQDGQGGGQKGSDQQTDQQDSQGDSSQQKDQKQSSSDSQGGDQTDSGDGQKKDDKNKG